MPLITRRSSTRATPRTLSGSNGRSRLNCSLLNQNSLKSRLLPLSLDLNHISAATGILLMGPDPRASMLSLIGIVIRRWARPAPGGLVLSGEQRDAFDHVTGDAGLASVVGYGGSDNPRCLASRAVPPFVRSHEAGFRASAATKYNNAPYI